MKALGRKKLNVLMRKGCILEVNKLDFRKEEIRRDEKNEKKNFFPVNYVKW